MLSFIVHSRCLDTCPSVNTMNRSPNLMKRFSHSKAKNSLNHTHPHPANAQLFLASDCTSQKTYCKLKCLFDTDPKLNVKWGVTHTRNVTHTLSVLKGMPGYNIVHNKINMFIYYI